MAKLGECDFPCGILCNAHLYIGLVESFGFAWDMFFYNDSCVRARTFSPVRYS
jgi:hypothetical protein